MTQIAIETVSDQIANLVQVAQRGEEVVFTAKDLPVARLIAVGRPSRGRKAGSAKHIPHYMAADFNETPEGFEDYMP